MSQNSKDSKGAKSKPAKDTAGTGSKKSDKGAADKKTWISHRLTSNRREENNALMPSQSAFWLCFCFKPEDGNRNAAVVSESRNKYSDEFIIFSLHRLS